MADTRRELAALQTLNADNTSGAITAQVLRDNVQSVHGAKILQTGAYGSEQADPVTGDVYWPNDGMVVRRYSGSAWVPWGPLFPLADPTLQTWAWINQGSATVSAAKGGIYLECVSNSSAYGVRLRKKAAPSAPYTITAALLFNYDFASAGNADFGLAFRASASGKMSLFNLDYAGNASAAVVAPAVSSKKMTDASTFSANYNLVYGPPYLGGVAWMRIADDNTNRICSFSADGVNWITFHSVGRTDFLTADEVGFYVNPYSARSGVTLLSWKEA